jgi:transposase-like protein
MPPVNRKQPKRAKSSESEFTLVEFMAEFPTDDACLEWLWRNRYSEDGTNAHCPKCDQERAFARYETSQQRQSWTCTGCGYHLHPTAGTVFHKSSTSLHLWFYAMYLMTSTRCGISAKQLERELGVTYKTAYRMGQLIRKRLMTQGSAPFRNGQPIEMDETYYGARFRRGTKRGRPAEGATHKQPVFGMVQRKGRVSATTVPNTKSDSLLPNVLEKVLPASIVYTDEYVSYGPLGKMGYDHHRIRHAQRVYVSGDVHTNTIEGFWSLVKRGLDGVFHGVSNAHLQGYLNEYAWRYNQRFDSEGRFRALLLRSTVR